MSTEPALADYPIVRPVATRWADNDMFGHLNNAVYYGIFDSVINGWLAEATGISPLEHEARGVVAESSCRFLAEVGFPDEVLVGLRIERLGTKSVTYQLAMFRDADGVVLADFVSPAYVRSALELMASPASRPSSPLVTAFATMAVDPDGDEMRRIAGS